MGSGSGQQAGVGVWVLKALSEGGGRENYLGMLLGLA